MNWRRGLFRTWVVATTFWVVGVAVTGATNWYNDPWRPVAEAPINPNSKPGQFDPSTAVPVNEIGTIAGTSLWVYVGFAVLPPMLLLLIGSGGIWAARGFSHKI